MKKIYIAIVSLLVLSLFAVLLVSCEREAECTHDFGEWEIIAEADCTSGGYRVRTCNICEYKDRRSVQPYGHAFSEEWEYDADYHWHATTCGHVAYADKGVHNYVDGVCVGCGTVTVSQGLSYRGILGTDTYKVLSSGNCLDANLVIARFYGGYRIVAVADEAFRNAEGINSIVFQRYIERIGNYALADNPTLTRVTMYYGTESIGDYCLANCPALAEIVFNGTVEQWNAIEKGENWDLGTDNYTVICSDGLITKQ